ncbi:glycosyltransferase family 2 protein [Haloactinopolyspora alba]|nr:glycosyltransferase family 2 protein [Haloactinopolyspora alba]
MSDAGEHTVFTLSVLALIYGGVVYQLARVGNLKRLRAHSLTSSKDTEETFTHFLTDSAPLVTILVPSYKEEPRVVEQTLFSAALQAYPNRRVVLLVDDPPNPQGDDEPEAFEAIRSVPAAVQSFFEPLHVRLRQESRQFEVRREQGILDVEGEAVRAAELYDYAAKCLRRKAEAYPSADHNDTFFVDDILLGSAQGCSDHADRLRKAEGASESQLQVEYERLVQLFRVEVTLFERKQYLNLSHEPNKAMNLNSYIGLVGGSYNILQSPEGRLLERAPSGQADPDLRVPRTKYLVTLDADSLLTRNYLDRLVHHMEQPGNEQVAVAQTPYTAVPNASNVLERLAGATTDIQYLAHQGSEFFSAAYWVGANAVLRTAALDDIRQDATERGYTISRFIQDRTVIEDTESTIDLIERGWRIYNYPARLAFSATPPDYGSILIQRRRWANGGLVILPKLVTYLFRNITRSRRVMLEGFIRAHYLVSPATVNTALLVLFAYPFDDDVSTYWLPIPAVCYFYLYARDLSMVGRRFSDIIGVYVFNLMLIPIQLGGVAKSIQQIITGAKTPFGRTPKVAGRTAAPRLYICAQLLLLFFFLSMSILDGLLGNWMHGIISSVNAVVFCYVITRLVGIRESFDDLRAIPPSTTSERPAPERLAV